MLELQNGHIVCLNSVLALSAIPGAIDYCTSKASAFAFMESLTLGLLDCPGVSATTVLPFHTSTEMFQGMRVRSVSRGRLPTPKSRRHPGPGRPWYALRALKFGNNPAAPWLWLCGLIPASASVGQRDAVGVGVLLLRAGGFDRVPVLHACGGALTPNPSQESGVLICGQRG